MSIAQAPDLADLLARCALRDRKAFEQLYAHTSAKLFPVVLRILKNKAQAEEELQEIYIKIWNNASKFKANGNNALPWMLVVARNHTIDVIRASKPIAVDIEEAYDLADEGKTPEANAINTDDGRQIENCLNILDENKAEAVRAAYVDGYSYEELATRYKVPINTMRTWLRRSLQRLRDCLEQ